MMKERELVELMRGLRAAREENLAPMPVERIVDAVDRAARRFLDPGDELRISALERMVPEAGFSPPMAREVLDGMARDWTREALEGLLASEFPDTAVLDGFRPGSKGREVRALGYPLTFHLGAGTVPGVSTTSLVRGLLVKSAVLLKPGTGDRVLPELFHRGLEEADAALARAVAVRYWERHGGEVDEASPRETRSLTETALEGADLVVLYGGDEAVEWVRTRLPATVPLRAYRHRMGVGLLGRGALGARESEAAALAARVARAVALFDQRGCVSPQILFVEEGGEVAPEAWSGLLAGAFAELEETLPSGTVPPEEGALLQQLRGAGEMKASAGDGTIHHGGPGAPWTVLFEPGGGLQPTCLNRTVRVIPVPELEDAVGALRPASRHLQTVGVAGLGEGAGRIREALARMGVSRMVGFDGVPWPRPWWHHDGEGPLRALVRWTDWE